MKCMLIFVKTAEDPAKHEGAEAPAYWAIWLGRTGEATAADARAIELSPDEELRQFLWSRMSHQA